MLFCWQYCCLVVFYILLAEYLTSLKVTEFIVSCTLKKHLKMHEARQKQQHAGYSWGDYKCLRRCDSQQTASSRLL